MSARRCACLTHEEVTRSLQIVANFGTDPSRPFKGDIDLIREEATARLHARILATRLPAGGKVGASVPQVGIGGGHRSAGTHLGHS